MAYAVVDTYKLDKPILQGLDASADAAVHDLGFKVTATTGEEYVYVATNASTLAASAGYPAYFFIGATTPWAVTSDYSDSSLDSSGFAGVFCCAVTAAATAHYVWIQSKGVAADCAVPAACAACDELVAVADYEFTIKVAGESSYETVAVALEADTSRVADIMIL